jgi:hypothetical protein
MQVKYYVSSLMCSIQITNNLDQKKIVENPYPFGLLSYNL